MAEITMPAAEVNEGVYTDEVKSYEFAFHILPTVAEGEVPDVQSKIKAHITNAGGAIFDEEAPERFDLVYPIVRHLEGKNRKFTSAYFGWIRFRLPSEKLEAMRTELGDETDILRSLLLRLTKIEEGNPFRFHEHRKSLKMVEVVDGEAEPMKEVLTETETPAIVEEEALNESLERITHESEKSVEEKAIDEKAV